MLTNIQNLDRMGLPHNAKPNEEIAKWMCNRYNHHTGTHPYLAYSQLANEIGAKKSQASFKGLSTKNKPYHNGSSRPKNKE